MKMDQSITTPPDRIAKDTIDPAMAKTGDPSNPGQTERLVEKGLCPYIFIRFSQTSTLPPDWNGLELVISGFGAV